LVAREYIRQNIVKEVKGKRAAGRIANWADICDELDGTYCEHEWYADGNGNSRNQCVHGCLAIAVRNREDRRALWREYDRRATEGRCWRWYRNAVWTRRAEFGQYFQFDFRFYLDLNAHNDVELYHAAKEDISNRVALDCADSADDVVLIEWFRQAQDNLLVELNGGRKFAKRRTVCKNTDEYGRTEYESNDTYANGGSTDDDVFATNAHDVAARTGSNRLYARNGNVLTCTNCCVYQCSTFVGDGNLITVAIG
jgi:hypothetical protein